MIAAAALVAHARSFDAVCDDAFITLRHASNLVHHGAPVYNLGERVEGYTSPLWMVLSAALLAAGVEGRAALTWLGAAAGAALVGATWRLWSRIAPGKPLEGAVALALVAGSTPIAAWTSSGLETPLFAALVALAVAELCTLAREPTRAHAVALGAVVALATLTRPEGALLGVAGAAFLARGARTRPATWTFLVTLAAPLVAFQVFRWSYYGALLPNTYVAKTAAPLTERVVAGLRYGWFTVKELGLGMAMLMVAGMVVPLSRPGVGVRLTRGVVALLVLVALVEGGDFLDLFRLFVPVLPLVYVLLVATSLDAAARTGTSPRGWALGVALVAPAWIAANVSLRDRALRLDDPARLALWIEPLAWTRSHALTWAEQGRFLRAHAHPGDTLASVSAGALPYHSGLRNLDLLGLTDGETARHGVQTGSRPGHQRFATLAYVLSRRPTYLALDACFVPQSWRGWDRAGYMCVDAELPATAGGTSHFAFFAEATRAADLEREGAVRIRPR